MKRASFYLVAAGFLLPIHAATLPEVVKDTLELHPKLQKEISDYEAIKHDLDIAKSGYRPTVDVSAGIGPEHTERTKPDFDADLTRKESEIMLRQNLFEGFATEGDIEEQEARITASRQYVIQEANSLALRAVETYVELLRQKALLDLLDKNVKNHERIYNMIREKSAAGLGRRSDLEQTEARVALAHANYIAQQNNYQDALINFERVYGHMLAASDLEQPEAPTLPDLGLDNLVNLALHYSPTLRLVASNIEALDAKTKKQSGNFYPTLDAELSAQWNDNIDGDAGRDDSYKAMLRMRYNLYNGGSDEALRLQNLQYVTSEQQRLNDQERAVLEKLKLAHMANQVVVHQLRCLRQHELATARTAASYGEEYQLGRRELLDLLNIEIEHNTAEQEVVKGHYELLISKYRILEAIGLLPHALQTGIGEKVEAAPLPKELAFHLTQTQPVSLNGEIGEFIDIETLCREFAPVIQKKVQTAVVLSEETANKALIMEDINFHFDSDKLTDKAKVIVAEYAKQLLALDKEFELTVTGHTDSIGTYEYNQDLSERRANTVRNALIAHGVDPKRIKSVGKGEKFPIASNMTNEGRWKNRRTEFFLKM